MTLECNSRDDALEILRWIQLYTKRSYECHPDGEVHLDRIREWELHTYVELRKKYGAAFGDVE